MKALRLVLLGLALALIAGVGFRLMHPDVFGPPALAPRNNAAAPATLPQSHPQDAATARSAVLSRLADVPDYIPFFEALRTDFPGDYEGLIDRTLEAVTRGAHVPNPDRLLADALRALRERRGVLAAQAEAGPLSSIFTAQSAMLDALAPVDPALCVDFLYGGMSPTFMAFSATHRDLVERIAMASLTAIKNGEQKHVERDAPTQADFDSLAQQLTDKNLSPDEISALLDGKTFDPPLPEARLCEAGRTYFQVLSGMPDDARLRIYALSAQLLARS